MASSEALWRFDVKEPNKLIAPARHRETITFSWDAPLSPSPMLRHAGAHFNGPTFDAQTSASKGSNGVSATPKRYGRSGGRPRWSRPADGRRLAI
jgi:hypothetical protein